MTARIEFPPPNRTLTLNDRLHWARKAAIVRDWRTAAYWAACDQLGAPAARRQPPSLVGFTIPVAPQTRRRDPHNWAPTVKAIVDGLRDAGLWPDDNADWVTTLEPVLVPGAPLCIVTVTPRETTP